MAKPNAQLFVSGADVRWGNNLVDRSREAEADRVHFMSSSNCSRYLLASYFVELECVEAVRRLLKARDPALHSARLGPLMCGLSPGPELESVSINRLLARWRPMGRATESPVNQFTTSSQAANHNLPAAWITAIGAI